KNQLRSLASAELIALRWCNKIFPGVGQYWQPGTTRSGFFLYFLSKHYRESVSPKEVRNQLD
ncbi:hypothetical protein, partial [Serratia marcescens]|uniref:hypothetical protein n=1 Tax=Serratia marcescens TaxID=615 RepID=UPI001C37BC83